MLNRRSILKGLTIAPVMASSIASAEQTEPEQEFQTGSCRRTMGDSVLVSFDYNGTECGSIHVSKTISTYNAT